MCSSEISAPTWVFGSSGSPITHPLDPRDEPLEERRLDAFVDEDAGAVRADLAGGVEIGEERAGHRIVEVGIVEDDERRLAAELQRHVLQRRRRVGHHRLAGADLAGERDLGDVRDGG